MSRVFGGCRVFMAAAKVGTKSAAASKSKAGLLQPHPVSPAMKKFLGVPMISRGEVVKKVWEHIKANQLQHDKTWERNKFATYLKLQVGRNRL